MIGFWAIGAIGVIMLGLSFVSERKNFMRGYDQGHQEGFAEGWKAAEGWIVTAETEIDQARQEIWRKGL